MFFSLSEQGGSEDSKPLIMRGGWRPEGEFSVMETSFERITWKRFAQRIAYSD